MDQPASALSKREAKALNVRAHGIADAQPDAIRAAIEDRTLWGEVGNRTVATIAPEGFDAVGKPVVHVFLQKGDTDRHIGPTVIAFLKKHPYKPRPGLSVLTAIVQDAGLNEIVPDDIDAGGRPRTTAIVPNGLFPAEPRVGFVSVRDRGDDALLALPGHVRESELPLFLTMATCPAPRYCGSPTPPASPRCSRGAAPASTSGF